MAGRLGTEARTARDGADQVSLERDRYGGGGGARELGIEDACDAVSALRGKIRARIEQPEIAGISATQEPSSCL